LYSTHNGEIITRTFAVVHYPEKIDSVFLKEHIKIIEGESLGSVFKLNHWKIEKKSIFFGEILPSNDFEETYKLMGNIAPSKLSIHIYTFYIKKNNKEFQYATISEIYHPNYLTLNDLKDIYKDHDKYLEKTDFVIQTLKLVTHKMKINYNE
jgi:hypothetical protein